MQSNQGGSKGETGVEQSEQTGDDGSATADDSNGLSRRGVLKAGTAAAGVAALGGVGMWYMSQPVVAAEVDNEGAENIVFGTEENVISVTDVTIQPEVDVAFSNFSSGVQTMELAIDVQVDAGQIDDESYEGTADTDWGSPTPSSDIITVTDTVTADGTTQSFSTPGGEVDIDTPDLTGQTSSEIGADDNFSFVGSIDLAAVLEEDAGIGTGLDMFPQDIDPDEYGLSVVDVDYAVTLTGQQGDSGTDNTPDHEFDVAVENVAGTTDDSTVDSNTDGSGVDGT